MRICGYCQLHLVDYSKTINVKEIDIFECDNCATKSTKVINEYDGGKDLLEHLQETIPPGSFCLLCKTETMEITGIKFGNPIEGYSRCKTCKWEEELAIYLDMI
ncbi:hypothetical protein ACXYMX_12155 [Sporosarcina sp. CAU 1771]